MKKYIKYLVSILLALLVFFSHTPNLVVNKMSAGYYYSDNVQIVSDTSYYDPYKTSNIGIGLLAKSPDLESTDNYQAKWSTNYGQFLVYDKLTVTPLGKTSYSKLNEKIYWLPNHNNGNSGKNIYFEIYVSLIDKVSGKILGKNKIKLIQYADGKVYVK
ncbi:hypothetical protein PV797_09580 [Clostridiaceae bacterium M8S5]|nr:hypothetical protein PV797_09580 [Clostridiaceae bacterium M8S5]